MEKYYTLNEVAMMTGLTTRTLRNYLKLNTLSGEKVDGVWRFTEEEVSSFLADPNVKPSIQAKKNALVYDFLLANRKKTNAICSILDFHVSDQEAEEIGAYFCNAVNGMNECGSLEFSFEKWDEYVRVILKGSDEAVREIVNGYYDM